MSETHKTIIDVLLEKNRLTSVQASQFSKSANNDEVEKKLLAQKLASPEDIAKAYAVVYDLPFIRLENYEISMDAFHLIPRELMEKYQVLAFEKVQESRIKVAIGTPAGLKNNPPEILAELKNKKDLQIDLYITTANDIKSVIARLGEKKPPEVKNFNHPIDYPQTSHFKTVDLKNIKIPYDVISKFPVEVSKKYQMVVFDNPQPNLIKVALSDPTNAKAREILDFVRDRNEINIEEYVASPTEINEAINLYYQKPRQASFEVDEEIPKPLADLAAAKPVPSVTAPVQVQTQTATIYATNTAPQAVFGIRPKFVLRPSQFQTAKPEDESTPASETQETEARSAIAPENDLDKFLNQTVKNIDELKAIMQTGNVPQILAGTISLAVFMKASDIHIEPEETDLRFRFRVDGILKDMVKVPLQLHPALISRVKILSRLKIDESRVPQDGRFDVKTQNHEIDLRVSTLPTVRGEKIALRILDKSQNIYTLEQLGITGRNLKIVEENISRPYGVILSTGPTGSGKSTTLYSILKKISTPAVNVITLEDPVEYEMPGINQCQVKPKIGFSFADGLRSVLRQDPNIIMVGEIRDAETAGMATHAALTGHLVLTTLHTNDAAGALPRLINMGIEPFLITSSINVVIGQRLVRKVCDKCKREARIPEALHDEIARELANLNFPQPYRFYEGAGCPECANGYSGRIGIFEVLTMTEKIEALAIQKRPASEIKAAAVSEGMLTMKQDGLVKALKGLTTVSEVFRVTLTE